MRQSSNNEKGHLYVRMTVRTHGTETSSGAKNVGVNRSMMRQPSFHKRDGTKEIELRCRLNRTNIARSSCPVRTFLIVGWMWFQSLQNLHILLPRQLTVNAKAGARIQKWVVVASYSMPHRLETASCKPDVRYEVIPTACSSRWFLKNTRSAGWAFNGRIIYMTV